MSTKIYANARFGLREDTLENWMTNNPVLEKGEPAVVRDGEDGEWLKIGDGVTSFNNLPWKKGPKGDKGEQGIQGDKGDKGDTGADGKDAVTDQTYLPESENAQSGIAVAEAINLFDQSKQKNYEHIATITVAPDENGDLPTSIVFTQDSNGNAFEITDFYCKVYAGISGVASPKIQITANNYILCSNFGASLTDGLRNWYCRFTSFGEKNGGMFSAPNATMSSSFPSANVGNGINLATPITSALNGMSEIAIKVFSSGGKWIENSEFELYGVRK